MWLDTHCHLSAPEFANDCGAVWLSAREAGVRGALLPAVDLDDCAAVAGLVAQMPGCFPAYGIHPLFVATAGEEGEALNRLTEWLEQKPPIAIGEIGLDGMSREGDWALQERFFLAQLKLARKYDLPVVLHVRRAVDRVLRGLRQVRVRGGIAHAFNGSFEQAKVFLKLGFKFGFGGSLTYPGSRRIRALAAELPLEAIVLETDAPDIPPVWLSEVRDQGSGVRSQMSGIRDQSPLQGEGRDGVQGSYVRGQSDAQDISSVWLSRSVEKPRNTPTELPKIGKALADLRGLSVETVACQTAANARSVLPGFAGTE
ncbi:MAG: TatD family hydrolase [Betaproteobacteria bacterium]|nr:TatD family hydrolase [Betaproteobacteria bacterium]